MIFTESLKKNTEFQAVYKSGRSKANKYFVIYLSENGLSINKIGISVSKKVGNSVVRHRVKRLVKEAYRLHENMFNSGLNIVILARFAANELNFKQTEDALLHLMRLHKAIK